MQSSKKLKIVHNKEKYNEIGLRFHIRGIPCVVVGKGVVMTVNPISNKKTWSGCNKDAKQFMEKHIGWFLPSIDYISSFKDGIAKSKCVGKTDWLWSSSLVGDKAGNYDFKLNGIYYDDKNTNVVKAKMHLFYSIF